MRVVIIGNGVSGVTSALEIRKISTCDITIISDEHDFFYSRTALMYVFMGQMLFEHTEPYERDYWKKNQINLIKAKAEKIDFLEKKITLNNNKIINYDSLILATGSTPKKLNIKGEDLIGVQNLYFKQDLEKLNKNCKNIKQAVVIGGGLTGIELCEMLISKEIKVNFIIKENYFFNTVLPEVDACFVHNYLKKIHLLDIHENCSIKEIKEDKNGKIVGVVKDNNKELSCDVLGVCIGVSPNIQLVKNSQISCNDGILVDEFLETSVKNVFAVGDCVELSTSKNERKKIEPMWHIAKKMGECVAENIFEKKNKYLQEVWINSAKFFEMEFHCVGVVNKVKLNNEEEFIWKDDTQSKLIHFVYDKNDKTFLAINVFGLRIKINTFKEWIENKKSIDYVIENLKSAFFNLELSKDYSIEINQLFLNKN